MRKFTSLEIKKIEKLNTQLSLVEENMYRQSKLQNQIALKSLLEKEDDIIDYELEIDISIFTSDNDEEPIISWSEYIKQHFLNDNHSNINDKENHNVTSCCWENKALNNQKHCWILHSLYDDYNVSWDNILKINNIWFDVNIRLQYSMDIRL